MKLSIKDSDIKPFIGLILYGKNSNLTKLGMTRMIREIHDKEFFELTPALRSLLEEIGIYETNIVNKSHRQRYNRELKNRNINDEVMIEHMISVKTIVNGMINLNMTGNEIDDIKNIRHFLETNTNCVVKLKNKEKELHG